MDRQGLDGMPEGDSVQAHEGEPSCSLPHLGITALLHMKPDPPGSFTGKTEVFLVPAIHKIPLSRFNTRLIRNYGIHLLLAKRTNPRTGSCIRYCLGECIMNRATEIERHQDMSSVGVQTATGEHRHGEQQSEDR
jgi:hypothetical protein